MAAIALVCDRPIMILGRHRFIVHHFAEGEMTAANVSVESLAPVRASLLKRALLCVLFFVVESAVFAIMPLSGLLPRPALLYMQAGLAAILLAVSLLLRRSCNGRPYWQVFYAFFVGALAVLVSVIFSGGLLALMGYDVSTPQGIAVAKFCESILRVATILAMMAAAGLGWRSMFLQRGRLGLGLAVGIPGFIVMAAIGLLPQAGVSGGSEKLLSWLPWILLFVLSNGFMEELLFRGILLKKYEGLLGRAATVVLSALVFTLVHMQVGYVASVIQFLVLLFPLALVWGWLMLKTDSLWGSALFHAGSDCIIIFGIFASMGAI